MMGARQDDAELIRRIGEALYGSRWQTDIARKLGVSNRAVRYWLAGQDKPSAAIWLALYGLAAKRSDQLSNVMVEISRRYINDPVEQAR